jgi:hypothetical protein
MAEGSLFDVEAIVVFAQHRVFKEAMQPLFWCNGLSKDNAANFRAQPETGHGQQDTRGKSCGITLAGLKLRYGDS